MKLPWKKPELNERIQELESLIEEKDEELERLQKMLDAEKERRSKLAKEKQNAEEKINRLKDRLKGLNTDNKDEEEIQGLEFEDIGFQDFKNSLDKLGSMRSQKNDVATVCSPKKLSRHSKIQEIKNSIPEKELNPLMNLDKLLIFYDPDLGLNVFKLTPFYSEKLCLSDRFHVENILDFISKKKTWVLVSRGNTKIYREENGNVEELKTVKSRINRQHGKGGFSQGRFERKRDEQVDQHLEEVESELQNQNNIYLLGEEGLCNQLPGKRVGGFDPNRSPLNNFYRPRRLKISSK